LFSIIVNAQQKSNLHFKEVLLDTSDFLDFDSLSTLPESFILTWRVGDSFDTSLYDVDFIKSELIWKGDLPVRFKIQYRTLSLDLSKVFFKKDTSLLHHSDTLGYAPFRFSSTSGNSDLFYASGLNKSGSISRGVMFGNNQDMSINSSLNLQLSGKISDDIRIVASITDDNIPIQPQGNTQQLQDFDQVYIQLFADKWKLTAGDFWMKKPKGYFMNYNKKAQGASVSFFGTDNFPKLDSSAFKTKASIAVSKGKFAQNRIQGIENNQGPYRLVGANNERFVIVLSGTELVYIDGELLTRGQGHDYTIDYNTAEITFTANRLITKDKRIVVEFQYSDKNYARSIVESSTELKINDWDVYFNVYSEQDAKNQPLQQELSIDDKIVLAEAGDDPFQALVPSLDSLTEGLNANRYLQKDSLGYIVLEYTTSDSVVTYGVVFTDFGMGNGDYVQFDFSAFGKVFSWVAPDTVGGLLIRKGQFQPVRILSAPKKRQMVSAGFLKPLGKHWKSGVEVAYSNFDANTFSKKDVNDNEGVAFKFILENKYKLKNNWTLTSDLNLETTSKNFQKVERFRDVTFTRDWNMQNLPIGDQYLGKLSFELKNKEQFLLHYGVNSILQDLSYKGLRNDLKLQVNKFVNVDYQGSFLLSEAEQQTSFYRHKTLVSKSVKWFKIGYKDEVEQNIRTLGDSTLLSSYSFYDYRFFIENSDSSKNRFKLFYRERIDKVASSFGLQNATRAVNPGVELSLVKNPKQIVTIRSSLRILHISDSTLSSSKPERGILNRIEYRARFLKGGITSTMFYEVGSGLELRKEFSYVAVPAGQGVYVWNDYNDDGVKDLNEFEIAEFADQATYLRVNTPSNNYIRVFNNQFSEVLSINFKNFVGKKTTVGKFVRRFNTQTTYRAQRKTTIDDVAKSLNPFEENIAEDELQSLNNSIRHSSFFNRTNSKFGLEHTFISLNNKVLLLSGFDQRIKQSNEFKLRLNLSRKLTLLNGLKLENKKSNSDYTSGRNYDLDVVASDITIRYQPNTKFRVSLESGYREKRNNPDLQDLQAYISEVGINLKYNKLKKGSLTTAVKYLSMVYNGEGQGANGSAVSYEMLESLQEGDNITWNVGFQRTFANNLQLTITYSGRKSNDVNAIHTGGMQLRAFF